MPQQPWLCFEVRKTAEKMEQGMKKTEGSGVRIPPAQPGHLPPTEHPWRTQGLGDSGTHSEEVTRDLFFLLQELVHPDTDIYWGMDHKADVAS